LWRLGSIAGRIVDELGEPVVDVSVQAVTLATISGQLRPVSGLMVKTDDRGLYLLKDLRPGPYKIAVLSVQSTTLVSDSDSRQRIGIGYLPGGLGGGLVVGSVVKSAGIAVDGRHWLATTALSTPLPSRGAMQLAYPPTFYPGVRSLIDAATIAVNAGEDLTGIDLALRPVSAVRVSGRVSLNGSPPPSILLRLMARGSETLGFGAETATTSVEADGSFTFLNVPSGDYTVLAQNSIMDFVGGDTTVRLPFPIGFQSAGGSSGSKPGAPGLRFFSYNSVAASWGRVAVSVGQDDIDALMVPLRSTVSLRGRVVFEKGVTPPDPKRGFTISAEPATGDPSLGNPIGRTMLSDPTSFEIRGLMGGVYLLDTFTFGRMAPISMVLDGQDHRASGFDGSMGLDFNNVVVTVTDRFPQVSGVVTRNGRPISAAIVAFPVKTEYWSNYGWTPVRLRSVVSRDDGAYQISMLAEGDYYLVAVEPGMATSWVDPNFLAAAARESNVVSVGWGDKRSVDLTFRNIVLR
jgi:hypothetical protein